MFYRAAALVLSFSALRIDAQIEGTIEPQDPSGPCTVCFTSGEEPNLAPDPSIIPFRGQTDMTCESIVASVAGSADLQGSDTCKNNQLAAYQLGCCQSPPYFYCTVCPDGSDYVSSNVLPLGLGTNPTCAEYEVTRQAYASLFTPGLCSDIPLQRAAPDCGCPGVERECSLCPDGQRPTNPERGDAWITGSTCEGLEFLVGLYKSDECIELRESYGVDFAHFCKCPDYEKEDTGTCVMCEDGIANPDFVYVTEPFERTCTQASDFASSVTRESICTREMGEAIAAGCECKNGSGPVFKAASANGGEGGGGGGDGGSAGTVSIAHRASIVVMAALLANGLLA
jgi:hypothetical protein